MYVCAGIFKYVSTTHLRHAIFLLKINYHFVLKINYHFATSLLVGKIGFMFLPNSNLMPPLKS